MLKEKFKFLLLKKILNTINNKQISNLYFFNISSFYNYLDYINKNKYNSKKIVDSLIKKVPLNLFDDEYIYFLLSSAMTTYNVKAIKDFKEQIYKRSVVTFLEEVYNANTKKSFNKIISLCNF